MPFMRLITLKRTNIIKKILFETNDISVIKDRFIQHFPESKIARDERNLNISCSILQDMIDGYDSDDC